MNTLPTNNATKVRLTQMKLGCDAICYTYISTVLLV